MEACGAKMTSFDLVVAGAGPAGLTLAWKAASYGLGVFLFDRKKNADHVAYTTSASFIDLKRWQLSDNIAHPISNIHLAFDGTGVDVPADAWVLNRRLLLAELEKKCVSNGVSIAYDTSAKSVEVRNDEIGSVTLSCGRTVQGKFYADCSGLGNVFNRSLHINTTQVVQALGHEIVVPLKAAPNTVDLYIGKNIEGGYGWLFPMNGDFAIVGVGTLRKKYFRRIKDHLDAYLNSPRVASRVKNTPTESHTAVFNTGPPLRTFHRGNLILVGDVGLQGHPIAGEGIRFVMDSAEMAARSMATAVAYQDPACLKTYSRCWTDRYYRNFSTNFKAQRFLYWLTSRKRLFDFVCRAVPGASIDTLLTLIRGEASIPFLLKKLPKVFTKKR